MSLANSSLQTGSITGQNLFATTVGNVTSTFNSTADIVTSSTTDSTNALTGSVRTAGGLGVSKTAYIGDSLRVLSTTSSSSPTTGSGTFAGGVGVGAQIYAGGRIRTTATTESTTTSTGALTSAGGAGIVKNLNVGGVITGTDATESSSTTTGAFITAGGAGIAKKLNVGGVITQADTTQCTSVSTGSFITAGGAAVTKNLFVGGTLRGMPSENWGASPGTLTWEPAGLTGTVTGGGYFVKVGPMVTLAIGGIYLNRAVAGASARLVCADLLPAHARPRHNSEFLVPALGDSPYVLSILTTGEISIYFKGIDRDPLELNGYEFQFLLNSSAVTCVSFFAPAGNNDFTDGASEEMFEAEGVKRKRKRKN